MPKDPIKGFTCEIQPAPIEKWVQIEDPEQCHSCLIAPLASHYLGTLEDAKAAPQVEKLTKAWESGDVLTIARTMDKIKAEVGEDLKKELLTLDCFTQSFKPEAAAKK